MNQGKQDLKKKKKAWIVNHHVLTDLGRSRHVSILLRDRIG